MNQYRESHQEPSGHCHLDLLNFVPIASTKMLDPIHNPLPYHQLQTNGGTEWGPIGYLD